MEKQENTEPEGIQENSNTGSPNSTVPMSAKEVFSVFTYAVRDIFDKLAHLADDTDIEGTITSIKKGIVLEGSNLWILICSVFIASIGLDVNSPAVIIGAMLISPLMSPILGIGLALGMNDRSTLISAIWNFITAVVLSLLVSVLYFRFLTPLGSATAEMNARIEPTLLDIFVAIFGGLAGIIAGSRRDKTNAIPGVAIATALMPPLCTAGFGLASGQMDYFFGAFYLFFLNAVFISLATYLIVRYLKFPMVQVLDPLVKRRARIWFAVTLILLITPSIYFLTRQVQERIREGFLENFIHENINPNVERSAGHWHYKEFNKNEKIYQLTVYSFGEGTYISQDSLSKIEASLNKELRKSLNILNISGYDSLIIHLVQSDKPQDYEDKILAKLRTDLLSEIQTKFRNELGTYEAKDEEISFRDKEIMHLREALVDAVGDTIPFELIKREVQVLYPEIENLAIANARLTDFAQDTTQHVLLVKWNKKLRNNRYLRNTYEARLTEFLKLKLQKENVRLVNF